jgi:hypothetical protein
MTTREKEIFRNIYDLLFELLIRKLEADLEDRLATLFQRGFLEAVDVMLHQYREHTDQLGDDMSVAFSSFFENFLLQPDEMLWTIQGERT